MQLETTRLLIRDFRADDAEALYRILSDPRVMRYIEPPYTMEQTGGFIEAAGLCDPALVYAVEWKAAKQLIGHVIFHPYDKDAYELGWVLSTAYWGKGIANELTQELLCCLRTRGVPEVVLECDAEQVATRRIAEKFGFRFVGVNENRLFVFRKSISSGEET